MGNRSPGRDAPSGGPRQHPRWASRLGTLAAALGFPANRGRKARVVSYVGGDPFELSRFVAAQTGKGETVVAELRSDANAATGSGLSSRNWPAHHSPTARRFGISGLAEAGAYLAHPVLAPRLEVPDPVDAGRRERRSADEIFGFLTI